MYILCSIQYYKVVISFRNFCLIFNNKNKNYLYIKPDIPKLYDFELILSYKMIYR